MSSVLLFLLGLAVGGFVVRGFSVRGSASSRDLKDVRSRDAATGAWGVERRWRPPYIGGAALERWASSVASGTTRAALRDGPAHGIASELVEQLAEGVSRAIVPDADAFERRRPTPCPELGQGTIGVTAAEAIAVAGWLHGELSPDALEELREDVTLVDEWLANGASCGPCALQGVDLVCVPYAVRPFACRTVLAESLARSLSEERGAPLAAREYSGHHADQVMRGVLDGLSSTLEQQGLDGTRYELHSALRRVLDAPEAEAAWLRGEEIFTGCRVVEWVGRNTRPSPGRRAQLGQA